MSPRRFAASNRAFTLLEIAMVVFLLMMVLLVGLPSMRGQLARHALQSAFERFDTLVIEAQKRSITDGEPYVLVWEKDGAVRLYPVAWNGEARRTREAAAKWLPEHSQEHYTLVRDGALSPQPPPEWTFWPSGNCEPATVKYQGASGTWEAVYNPLSARSSFKTFVAL